MKKLINWLSYQYARDPVTVVVCVWIIVLIVGCITFAVRS